MYIHIIFLVYYNLHVVLSCSVAVQIVPTTTVAVVPPRKILQPSAAEEAKRIVPKAVEVCVDVY